MHLKTLSTLLLSGAAVVALNAPSLAADYTLNVNTALNESDPLYEGLNAFVANVAEASGGQIEIKLFPGSQLGSDEDVLEQARSGAPVAVIVDGGRLAVFQEEFGVLGAPFLANGYDGIRKVVTSDLFEGWVGDLAENAGLQILSFNWWQGERHLLTNKPINSPDDLAGVRMRTPGAPVWIETVNAMGATATAMAWADVRVGIETNAIDAAEAQIPAIVSSGLNEVITHVTKTGHINLITGMVTSAEWYNSLPGDLQQVLRDEALKAGDIASYATRDSFATYEQQMTDEGITITTPDLDPYRERTAGVYETLGYGELRDTLRAIAAE